jgi:hypothetical protein
VGCDLFRDETYGDVKTLENNIKGRIIQGRIVQGRIVQGLIVQGRIVQGRVGQGRNVWGRTGIIPCTPGT